MKASPLVALVALLSLSACSSSTVPPAGAQPGSDSGMPAASDDAATADATADAGPLAPPAAGQGVQYEMMTTIPAGVEDERCMFVVAPAGGMWINKEQVWYTPGSHHFLLWTSAYTSIPTKNTHGNTVDTSGVFECSTGPQADWDITWAVAGSQSFNGPPLIANLPANVAVRVEPGTVLLLDLHVLNATAQAVDTDARINLWTAPASQITVEASVYGFYNPFIKVPAHGAAAARMSCPVTSDVTIVNAQSHMHARGLGGVANLLDIPNTPGTTPGTQMYISHDWTNVPVDWYTSPPLVLKKGQAIDFQCNYQSQQDTDVYQGLRTTDEMCLFSGVYYPRDKKFETCSTEGLPSYYADAATFIGTGTSTCSAALACMAGAGQSIQGLTPCIVDSCPKAGPALTAVLYCEEAALSGACGSMCSGGGSGCLTCLESACGKQLTACESATCN